MENTKKIPILIYVTKAKPYLSLDLNPQRKTYGLYRLCKHPDPSKDGEDDQDLNGLVCFECECKEAFDISKVVQTNKNLQILRKVYNTEEMTFYQGKTGLTLEQMETYQGNSKTLYAYHLENVKAIEPFPITELYSDEACMEPLTKAPQSYCFAYRKVYIDENEIKCTMDENDPAMVYAYTDGSEKDCFCEDDGRFYRVEKYLIFSIRSPYVALEMNIDPKTGKPFKDLETRKTRIANFEIEYK